MEKGLIIAIGAVVFLICNLICFILMWRDKHCARNGKWRISERALFVSCLCFGGVGGVLGMQILRHKTKHWYFKLFFPLIMVVQLIIICLAAYLFLR